MSIFIKQIESRIKQRTKAMLAFVRCFIHHISFPLPMGIVQPLLSAFITFAYIFHRSCSNIQMVIVLFKTNGKIQFPVAGPAEKHRMESAIEKFPRRNTLHFATTPVASANHLTGVD